MPTKSPASPTNLSAPRATTLSAARAATRITIQESVSEDSISVSLSLLERMAATASDRHQAIQSSRSKHAIRSYLRPSLAKAWVGWPSLRSRGLHNIVTPMIIVVTITVACTASAVLIIDDGYCDRIYSTGTKVMSLLTTALSFLLVFRLNRTSVRHYEARQLYGGLIACCRDLSLQANAALGREHADVRDRLCEVAVAFPVATMLHLWGNATSRANAFGRMVDGVFADAETFSVVQHAKHRPLALVQHAETIL